MKLIVVSYYLKQKSYLFYKYEFYHDVQNDVGEKSKNL